MEFKKNYWKLKCPHPNCDSVTEFHEIVFPIENDKGEVIFQCQKCHHNFTFRCQNPEESYVQSDKSTSVKINFIDYDLEEPSQLPIVQDAVLFQPDKLFKIKIRHQFDYKQNQIYLCKCKQCNLEEMAYSEFFSKWKVISSEISKYDNSELKGYGFKAEHSVIKINLWSKCNERYSAIFYTNYSYGEYFEYENYLLANIQNADSLEETLSGTFTKTQCMDFLKKLIIRWGLFYEKILIISPYIESPFAKSEKVTDTFLDLISQIPKYKETTIYTKTQTLNFFKKHFGSVHGNYEFYKEYDLGLPVLNNAKKINNSHAKLYIGMSSNNAELLLGSANIANGNSLEVINFRYLPTETLYKKYLDAHLKERILIEDNRNVDVLFDEDNNFSATKLDKNYLLTLKNQ